MEEEDEGWQRVKKSKGPSKPIEKRGPSNALKSNPKAPPKDPVHSPALSTQPVIAAHEESPPSTSIPEVPPVIIIQESSATKSTIPVETQDSQGGNALEPGEIKPKP